MARPDRSEERREEVIPIVARTFAELGYRRSTTAELARRAGVRENILYRLWPDKRSMFLASIEYVYRLSEETWERFLAPGGEGGGARTPAERILEYESVHHGEFGLYRIVFAGLSETDDPEIRRTLGRMYRRFHSFIRDRIAEHHAAREAGRAGGGGGLGKEQGREAGEGKEAWPFLEADLCAWAVMGLGTAANIGRELGLMGRGKRKDLFREFGKMILGE